MHYYIWPFLISVWGGYEGMEAMLGDMSGQLNSLRQTLDFPPRVAGTLIGIGPGAAVGYYLARSMPEYQIPYILLGALGGGLIGNLLGSSISSSILKGN